MFLFEKSSNMAKIWQKNEETPSSTYLKPISTWYCVYLISGSHSATILHYKLQLSLRNQKSKILFLSASLGTFHHYTNNETLIQAVVIKAFGNFI